LENEAGTTVKASVNLGNTLPNQITDVCVGFQIPEPTQCAWSIPLLGSGNWRSIVLDIPAQDTVAGKQLVLSVRYKTADFHHSVTSVVSLPGKSNFHTVLNLAAPVLLGAIVSLLGGLAGVWLTSTYNIKKEKISARLQWSRFLVEHYDQQYREFLARCMTTIEETALNIHFRNLDENALLAPATRACILSGLARIQQAPTADQKKEAREQMLRELRDLLARPF
jgi:hypothetical protein